MKHPNVYVVFLNETQPFDGRAYLHRDAAYFVLSHVSPRLNAEASVVTYGEIEPVNDAPKDEVLFYAIEAEHLERLKTVAKRLYTENRMNGDEMRDAAHGIMSVVRYAESLQALRGAGELYVHLNPKEKP